MRPVIVTVLCAMTASYCFLYFAFRESASILGLPPPAAKYCPSDDSQQDGSVICSRSDLVAFQITCGFALTACGLYGVYIWHIQKTAHTVIPQTPQGRIFGYLPQAELLAAICFAFQVFDFAVSLAIPEYRTPIMLTHHVMAATVSWCAVQFEYLHYYGVFFVGLTEVSSIFLVVVDLAQYFPPEKGSAFDLLVGVVCGPLFAICFVYYRVFLWWPISWRLFRDAWVVMKSGQVSELRPGKEWVLVLFLIMNLPLGILQLYWLTIILDEAQKIVL